MNIMLQTRSIVCALFVMFALSGCTEQTSLVGSDQTPALDQARSASKRGATKFTFNDVVFSDDTLGELEASSKINKKVTYTTCSYFSDDYASFLGYFESDQDGFTDPDEVKAFCLANYENRV